jgi:hypothetical protein
MEKTLNFFGFIIGLLGLIIGCLSYFHSVKKKEISYNIYEQSYKILDNEVIDDKSNLIILTKDSLKINQNIYLSTVSIWNSGDLTINESDVRKKIKVELYGIDKIIDLKLIKENLSGISKFKYEFNKDSIYNINWKFFDPNHGIKLQILYLGKETISGKLNGNILDTNFNEFVPEKKEKLIKQENGILKTAFALLLFISLGILPLISLIKRIKNKEMKEVGTKREIIIIIFWWFAIAYFIFLQFYEVNQIPF